MIKIVSFIIFTCAFIWSWFLFNAKNSVGIDVHAGIQSKLAILIENAVKKQKPNSTEFKLIKMYTEKIDDSRVIAKFSFKYADKLDEKEITAQILNGEAVLSRGLSENPEIQKWIIQSVKSNSNQLEFREGLVISSDGKSTEDVSSEAKPAEHSEEKSESKE